MLDKKFLASINNDLAHMCGSLTSCMMKDFEYHFDKDTFKSEPQISTQIALKQFRTIRDLTEFKLQKPYYIVQPRLLITETTDEQVNVLKRLYGPTMHDLEYCDARFIGDPDRDFKVDFTIDRTKMEFKFTIVVSTEYQQINFLGYMRNKMRFEDPISKHKMVQIVLPDKIIKAISEDSGVPILDESGKPNNFLRYLNTISKVPISLEYLSGQGKYRFRTLFQIPVLMKYTDFDFDQGKEEGKTKTDFTITCSIQCAFNYPTEFFYYSGSHESEVIFNSQATGEEFAIEDLGRGAAIFYTFQEQIIPEEDSEKRQIFANIAIDDIVDNEKEEVDIRPIFRDIHLYIIDNILNKNVFNHTIDEFLGITIYEDDSIFSKDNYDIDYDTMKLTLRKTKKHRVYRLVVYGSNSIVNEYAELMTMMQ